MSALVLLSALPMVKRAITTRFWCVVTPHRVRHAFARARIVSRQGKLPVILMIRPTKLGERLWVWLRAGTSPGNVERASDLIAAACWARSVRIQRDRYRASLIVIDVLRRGDAKTPRDASRPEADTTPEWVIGTVHHLDAKYRSDLSP
ncbi:hypothetical protein [Microbispora sp. NPDC049633]|uniref:hypothetical protein n=1 Tax=Microbispora sp. NPDC049633 TaxID=3154355 RepID=UPI00343C2BFF